MATEAHKNYCYQQIKRLGGMQFFEKSKEWVTELVKTLAESTLNDFHARAVVDQILASMDRSPMPVDIKRIANDLRDTFKPQNPDDSSCTVCFGCGWVLGYVEYEPGIKNGIRRYWVRNVHEPEIEFMKRIRDYETGVMPSKRVMGEIAYPCQCPAGRVKLIKPDAA